ncbi:tripartite tricarboxylate transporter permease [Neomoorella mulderi]|uniref:Tripartite tricarboxylate transporter TctA family protein n=1 Tax=Moorella mulderi DSM 14980 TaxID=1122241 RepID=A0A151ATX4_9FIRM|nr:tripartite tricarboxylate transporter permease [Moorella mulderi]KYH31032.1 tripartite tricarboxylate transporter TctA family protein [Moorella mulderi DSM 14980]
MVSDLHQLLHGFAVAISPVNILAGFVGAFLGTIVGVLPGLGPTATMSLMLPFTLMADPLTGLIMLAGVYLGAQYGGSTTSILVNIPGEAASVVTAIDGYQMAKKGRAGAALALVALGSWIAGTLGIIGLQLVAAPLGKAALAFGPPEYFALMVFAFVVIAGLTGTSLLKGLLMAALGLWIATIGIDPMGYGARFTFGLPGLLSGVDFLPMAMGLFGIAEILTVASERYIPGVMEKIRLRDLYPRSDEVKRSIAPMFRGSLLGFFVGLLPGPSPTISTFLAYAFEKRLSKNPQEFGKGAVEGVVAPESANNAAATASLIPLLCLGLAFTAPSAVLLAGLRIHNIEPGPFLFREAPDLFWGFIASMYLANCILLLLNLPFVGILARLATVRPQVLMPIVSVLCLVGVYSVRNSIFDIWIMLVAGVLGFFLRKWGFPVAPLVIGLVLGGMAENSYRQTCMMAQGNLGFIFNRPIALALFLLALVVIVVTSLRRQTSTSGELSEDA